MEKGKKPWYSVKLSRVFGLLGLILLIGFLADVVYYAFESWVTPGERRATILALDDINRVRNSDELDEATYEASLASADQAVKKADSAAFTLRDHIVSNLLDLQLKDAQLRRVIWLAPDEKVADRSESARERKLKGLVEMDQQGKQGDETIKALLGIRKHE
jgi:hypothetical protein